MTKCGYTEDFNEWKALIEEHFYHKCIFNDAVKSVGKFSIQPHFEFNGQAITTVTYMIETWEEMEKQLKDMAVVYVVYQSPEISKFGNTNPYIMRGISKFEFDDKVFKKNFNETIVHHENGDSEFTFKVKMTVGASDKQGSSVDVGGLRFRIQSYYNEETRSNFFVLQEGSYDTRIYNSPEFENIHSATRWLINYIKGT